MADMMNFPKRWEDFLHDYEFEDARRIYTNGARLIPSFRVKQMMEHYAPVRHGRWVDKGEYAVCMECGGRSGTQYDGVEPIPLMTQFCPNCGCRMDGGAERRMIMKCKFEHDGNCCNSGAKQYMCKCQKPCDAIIQMTNAQKIRVMSDEELNELFHEIYNAGAEDAVAYEWGQRTNSFEWTIDWLQQPAE